MFEFEGRRLANFIDEYKEGFKKVFEPKTQYGDYEVGYASYVLGKEKYTDCIYVKNIKTNEIEKEIPWGYSAAMYSKEPSNMSLAKIKKVSDDGMVFVGQGEQFIGAGLHRNYYILDLKNNKVIDDVDNYGYSESDLRYLQGKREKSLEDVLLENNNIVFLKDGYFYNMDTRQRLHLDENFWNKTLFSEMSSGEQYERGFFPVTDENGRKCILNLKNNKLYQRTDGENLREEMFTSDRIERDIKILDKMPDFLFLALEDKIRKSVKVGSEWRKNDIKEDMVEPVKPKKPFIMLSANKKDEYADKVYDYEMALSDYNKNEYKKLEYNRYCEGIAKLEKRFAKLKEAAKEEVKQVENLQQKEEKKDNKNEEIL